jgi:environmental stress-induced protein Ves
MTSLTVLRADDHPRMPWANGGGTTYQVASSPHGAGFDTFDWRVSLADIDASGPFSSFPGIDRMILVVAGAGVELDVDGRPVVLGPLDQLRFDGAAHTTCRLTSGPTKDLNVMTRRGRCNAALEVVTVAGETHVAPVDGGTVLTVVVAGDVRADDVPLWARDVLVVDRATALRGTATVALVTINDLATA